MKLITNIFLFPFMLLYGLGVYINNLLYSSGFSRSIQFDLPVICVGNLSVGGTGKTPHVDYIVKTLKDDFPTGVLSRGYKRKTTGYKEVALNSKAIEVGDEPLLLKWKNPSIDVAVAESRSFGIPQLFKKNPANYTVVLDDAFQHRSIRAGLSILLTQYNDRYTQDTLLPIGRLREFKSGAKRADIIIVSNCPINITNQEIDKITAELQLEPYQKVFFSHIHYLPFYSVFESEKSLINIQQDDQIIVVSAIANNESMLNFIKEKATTVYTRTFPDHHQFTESDIESIIATYENLPTKKKYIITTEKDATRLHPFAQEFLKKGIKVVCLPIEIKFIQDTGKTFDDILRFFVYKTLEDFHKA